MFRSWWNFGDDGNVSFVDLNTIVGKNNGQIKSFVVDKVEPSDKICSYERSYNVYCTTSLSTRWGLEHTEQIRNEWHSAHWI